MVRISSTLFATAALLSTTTAINTAPASGFVASDSSVTFALNIPQKDDSNDLYFTLAGPSSSSWIAVGMGSNKMANSLVFMAYSDSTGKNVTLSPRLAYDEVEPSYTSNISVTVLPGSGISNNTMTVNAMCTNCRSWKGGSIDPTNTAANFIFGVGPGGSIKSNSGSANIKRHSEYGIFTMDLTKAFGVAGVPVALTADTAGTTQTELKNDHDFSPALHACIMILAFVGLMPLGIMILRIFNSPKWHGWNQTLSAAIAVLGAGLGVYCGTMYNRSKNFNSVHQIFGAVIIVAMIAQFVLGFLHHRMYKRTLAPTKLSPIHVWLGRVVIPCGIANGFLGFPLALNPKYNWALVTLVLLVIIVMGPFAFWRWKRNNAKKMNALAADSDSDGHGGYHAQPWNTPGASQSDINLGRMDTGYQPTTGYPPTHGAPPMYGQPPVEDRQFV